MTDKFMKNTQSFNWQLPSHWHTLKTIDAHTGGEPLRIYISGFPDLKGDSVLDRRRDCRDNYDYLRTATMWEPRGHADMYGCILMPAVRAESDFAVLFTHNEGYSSMCGHGIIAVTKVVLETGLMAMQEPVTQIKIDSPAGLIIAYARVLNGHVESVYFHNVPSFVEELDASIEIPGIGTVNYDLAFGGAYYAFVQARSINLSTRKENVNQMIDWGRKIKQAVMTYRQIKHPFDEDLGFLYGTIFIDDAENPEADSRNVCIFADGEVDRSPTGTGVSARAAIHYKRGELSIGESMVIESIIGSSFVVTPIELTEYGPYQDAIVPEVEGQAYITGCHEFVIDPDDPLKNGFILR